MTYGVFIAEDEHLIRNTLKKNVSRIAGDLPIQLIGDAPDGELALAEILQKKPDILMTDIRMPFMDGLELAAEVKKHLPEIKIIFISGFDEFAYAKAAISLQAQEYLLKPIKYDDLKETLGQTVKKLDEERTTINQTPPEDHLAFEVKKNHYLNLLFKGSLSLSEALQQGQLLQRNLAGKTFQVMLIANQLKKKFEDYSSFRQILQTRFDQDEEVLVASVSSRYIKVLVLLDPEAAIERKSRQIAEEFFRLSQEDQHTQLVAAIGTQVQRISEIPLSYQTAEKILHFEDIIEKHAILTYQDFTQLISLRQPEVHDFYTALEDLEEKQIPTFVAALDQEINNYPSERTLRRLGFLLTLNLYVQEHLDLDHQGRLPIENDPAKLVSHVADQQSFQDYLIPVLEKIIEPQINPQMNKHREVLARSMEYINQHFANVDLSLNEVADEVNLSSSHFSSIFSQALGKTFVEYLTERRLREAKRLLITTDWKLSTIATEVGYNDPNYFSYIFKRKEQITPKEYRKQQTSLNHL